LKNVRPRKSCELFDCVDATTPNGSLIWEEKCSEGDVMLSDELGVAWEAIQKERPRDICLDACTVARRSAVIEAFAKA
jgi:hypothetical protein